MPTSLTGTTSINGINVESPLSGGTLIVIANQDQPGVIGAVGTILGSHKVNIASFALGRIETGAYGIVGIDEATSESSALEAAVESIRKLPAIRDAWIVRLGV